MSGKKVFMCSAETVVVNIIVYYLFFILEPNQDTYLRLNPHPLLILSVFMGMRYGNYPGLVGAAISSMFYMDVFLKTGGGFLELFRYFANYKYILLFFWSALIFGTFKDNHDMAVARLNEEHKLLKKKNKQLKDSFELTKKVEEELKKQIIGSEESILHLYEIASRLETLDSEQVYTETIGILSKYLGAYSVSIYTYSHQNGFLRLKIKIGETGSLGRSLFVRDSDGFSKVAIEKRAIKWQDAEDEKFPLMSAPLIKNDEVIAVVNVEHMDFDRLSEYAFQLFKLIIDWVNKALDRAIFVDGLMSSKHFPETNLLKYEFFLERFREEERRRREFGMEFGFLQYRAKNMDPESIDGYTRKIFRSVDVVGFNPDNEMVYILLPATPQENLYLIEERIASRLGNQFEKIEALSQMEIDPAKSEFDKFIKEVAATGEKSTKN